jgi:hypothetical protein
LAFAGASILEQLDAREPTEVEEYRLHLQEVIRKLEGSKLDATNSIPKDWRISDVRLLLSELKKAKKIGVSTLYGVKYIEGAEPIAENEKREPVIVISTEEGKEGAKYGSTIELRLVRDRFAVIDIGSFEE